MKVQFIQMFILDISKILTQPALKFQKIQFMWLQPQRKAMYTSELFEEKNGSTNYYYLIPTNYSETFSGDPNGKTTYFVESAKVVISGIGGSVKTAD